MTQKKLNSAYIRPGFEQVDSVGVAQGVWRRVFPQTSALAGLNYGIADRFPG